MSRQLLEQAMSFADPVLNRMRRTRDVRVDLSASQDYVRLSIAQITLHGSPMNQGEEHLIHCSSHRPDGVELVWWDIDYRFRAEAQATFRRWARQNGIHIHSDEDVRT
jgi:hypothetical protein